MVSILNEKLDHRIIIFFIAILFSGYSFAQEINIATPALVNIFPSTNTVYLNASSAASYRITIQNRTDTDIAVSLVPSDSIKNYFVSIEQPLHIAEKSSGIWKYNVVLTGQNDFNGSIAGYFTVDVENGQEQVNVPVTLQKNGSFLNGEIGGFPAPMVVLLILILIAIYMMMRKE